MPTTFMPPTNILDTYNITKNKTQSKPWLQKHSHNHQNPEIRSNFRFLRCRQSTSSNACMYIGTFLHETDLTSMFGDPILVNRERLRIRGLRFGLGPLSLVVLGRLDEGTSRRSGVVWRSRDQIKDEASVQG